MLSSNRVQVLDSETGEFVARFDLGEWHRGVAFADNDHLYLGSDSGVLRVVAREASGSWSIRQLWQSEASIRWLAASPRSRFLVLVDQDNVAKQFSLAEGRLGAAVLQLPSPVEEAVFTPSGSRVLFRTARWLHAANSVPSGLIWTDAMLAPKALGSAHMIFGNTEADKVAAAGYRVYLPVAGDSEVRLAELNFATLQGTGLFGSKDQLLEDWRRRLGYTSAYE